MPTFANSIISGEIVEEEASIHKLLFKPDCMSISDIEFKRYLEEYFYKLLIIKRIISKEQHLIIINRIKKDIL